MVSAALGEALPKGKGPEWGSKPTSPAARGRDHRESERVSASIGERAHELQKGAPMRAGLVALVAATTLLVTIPSEADDDDWAAPAVESATQNVNDFIDRTELDMVEPQPGSSTSAGSSDPAAPATSPTAPVVVDLGPSPIAPKHMAEQYPESSRPKMEQAFDTLLSAHHQLEDHYNVPRGDLAFALAVFIVGAYAAHHHQEVPDEYVPPLVDQLRRKLNAASTPAVSP